MGEETRYFCMNKPCPAAIPRWGQKSTRAKVALFILIFKLFSLLPKSTASKEAQETQIQLLNAS